MAIGVYPLNITFAQRRRALWEHLRETMERDEMWSAYAESYDPIIGEFTDYKELVERVVAQIDGAENCLDIGAGTGNTTIELHRKAPKRHVHAVDVNHNMLRKLHTKLEQHPRLQRAYNNHSR